MLRVIIGAATALILLAALVRLFEPHFAFYPIAGETVTPRDRGVEYEPLTIDTSDGERLRAWSLSGSTAGTNGSTNAAEHARARILYFHGNGGNLSVWMPILTDVAARGFDVFAFDYRGYGVSSGRPTEQGLYRDVEAVVERFSRDRSWDVPTLYWGRSLGVAMAAYAATIRRPSGLILESGFSDARTLIRTSPVLGVLGLFSTYRFPAHEFLTKSDAVPALVLHGDADRIVPIEQGRILFEGIAAPKRFVVIHGGDHNDLTPPDPREYWDAVDAFVRSLTGRG